eukprot:364894-Chlamydomonas_euryale.AAC.4
MPTSPTPWSGVFGELAARRVPKAQTQGTGTGHVCRLKCRGGADRRCFRSRQPHWLRPCPAVLPPG